MNDVFSFLYHFQCAFFSSKLVKFALLYHTKKFTKIRNRLKILKNSPQKVGVPKHFCITVIKVVMSALEGPGKLFKKSWGQNIRGPAVREC